MLIGPPSAEWTAPGWLMNSAAGVGILSVIALVIRMIGPWRKQITDTEERMREELRTERERCETELRIVRHRERGSRQMIYSLLHVAGMPEGERRQGALESVHATLTELERVEAIEAGLLPSSAENDGEGGQ